MAPATYPTITGSNSQCDSNLCDIAEISTTAATTSAIQSPSQTRTTAITNHLLASSLSSSSSSTVTSLLALTSTSASSFPVYFSQNNSIEDKFGTFRVCCLHFGSDVSIFEAVRKFSHRVLRQKCQRQPLRCHNPSLRRKRPLWLRVLRLRCPRKLTLCKRCPAVIQLL